MEENLKKLSKLKESYNELNKKLKLFVLLTKAKDEYDKYDYSSGRKTLKEALSVTKENPEIYRGLGCIEQFDGHYETALEYFNQSLKYSQNKEVDYTLIGMVYYLLENYDEALKYFDLALAENIDYESAYEGKNQALLESHVRILDIQEALEKCF